jgi:nucleoside-diphosphate-sugar epimerase
MKVFLTGGSGYVGRPTVQALRRHGHEVSALARSDASARVLTGLGATPVSGDLTDTDVLREAAAAADGVIHLGQHYGDDTAEVDLAAAEALQEGLGDRGPYVHTGGVWVYGDTAGVVDEDAPQNPPAITAWRRANEERVLSHGGHPVLVMPGLVYGLGGGPVARLSLAEAVARMGPIAEAFALDQQLTPARARRELGWTPRHLDALRELRG